MTKIQEEVLNMSTHTLAELAKLTQTQLKGNPETPIQGISSLASATESDVSFLGSEGLGEAGSRYLRDYESSQAGAICISPTTATQEHRNYLVSEDPRETFQQLIQLFAQEKTLSCGFTESPHPSATLHPACKVSETAQIGPGVIIDQKASIGARSQIMAGTYIGPGVSIGEDCLIHPNCVIEERSQIGNRVILQAGVVIGGCGFGYQTTAQGEHKKLTHLGDVLIEDDVEIGANATIDRARFQRTRIGKGSKIDNLVMIAHGVEVGSHNLIVAQSGIAGSTQTGGYVVIGAQTGVVGHIYIESGTMIGARSGVSKSLKRGTYQGYPIAPIKEHQKRLVHFQRNGDYAKRLKVAEKKVQELESQLTEIKALLTP